MRVIRVASFSAGAAERVRALARGHERIVLDLRGNPGGLLDEAVDRAVGLPRRAGRSCSWQRRARRYQDARRRRHGAAAQRLAVLVDGRTASAAEIARRRAAGPRARPLLGTRTLRQSLDPGRPSAAPAAAPSNSPSPRTARRRGRDLHGVGVAPDVRRAARQRPRARRRARPRVSAPGQAPARRGASSSARSSGAAGSSSPSASSSPARRSRSGAAARRRREPGDLVAVQPERGRGGSSSGSARRSDVRRRAARPAGRGGRGRPVPRRGAGRGPRRRARARGPRPGPRRPARPDRRSRSTRRARRTSTTPLDRAARATACALWVHIADVAHHVRAGGALDARRAGARSRSTCRARSSRCCRTSSPSGACSLQEGRDRRAMTVEVLARRASMRPGEPRLLPLADPQPSARLTYHEAHDILEGRARARRAGEPLELADRLARRAARAPLGARRARDRPARARASSSTARTRRRARLRAEPRAHALVEELMILANEHVADAPPARAPAVALPRPRAARARGHRGRCSRATPTSACRRCPCPRPWARRRPPRS